MGKSKTIGQLLLGCIYILVTQINICDPISNMHVQPAMRSSNQQYQDIIIDNQIVSTGLRDSATRYEAIKMHLLGLYHRPFTVLDIGAAQGFFSFKTAYDFPHACAVMIEGDYANTHFNTPNQLEELCKQNKQLGNIIFLKKHMSVQDLERLSECEHFDVVLCLNVIHHFGKNWRRAADAIFKLGDHIVVETPPSTDKVFANNKEIKALENYLNQKNGKTIAKTPRHTDKNALALTQIFESPKKNIPYKHWFYGSPAKDEGVTYQIESNFEKKTLLKCHGNAIRETSWLPGINLITFKTLNGVWPNTAQIVSSLIKFYQIKHRDLFPWNIIVQGNTLSTIDDDGPLFSDPLCCLLQTIKFASLDSYISVQEFILNDLYPRQWLNECSGKRWNTEPLVAEVSLGELIDKITILEIKSIKTNDASKLKNINYELSTLMKTLYDRVIPSEKLDQLKAQLYNVNLFLWDIEDQLREKERTLTFDKSFITLARSVYITNDRRSEIKREINVSFGSQIVEEKIYQPYTRPTNI